MEGHLQPLLVEIPPGRAPVERLLGAIDAALASDEVGVRVRVPLDRSDPRHAALAELTRADPRVTLGSGDGAAVSLPASARPGPRTLALAHQLLRSDGLGRLAAPVPTRMGRFERLGVAARLPGRSRMTVRGTGTGSRIVMARRVELGSVSAPLGDKAPPKGELAHERAEHLRHRARSATYRARMDRYGQRLSRERLQTRHERARARLADERLAAVSPAHWLSWRARQAGSLALSVPRAGLAAAQAARGFARRALRFATDRLRTRRAGDQAS